MPTSPPSPALPPSVSLDVPTPATPNSIPQLPTHAELHRLTQIANAIASSRMGMPKGCTTAQALLVKMLMGREFGISPMVSVYDLDVNDGKITMGARTMVAVVRRRELGDIRLQSLSPQGAQVLAWRADEPDKKFTFSFTMEQAQKAGLLKKITYQAYGDIMFLWRATTQAARALFPEIFHGIAYSPEELGGEEEPFDSLDFADPLGDSGIELKPSNEQVTTTPEAEVSPAVSSEAISQATNPVLEPQTTPSPPSAAPATELPVTYNTEDQKNADVARIATIAQALQLPQATINDLCSRLRTEPSTEWITPAETNRIVAYLTRLKQLRGFCRVHSVTPELLQPALTNRGVGADWQLAPKALDELYDSLVKKLGPF